MYKFRRPLGDDTNYRKVIFSDGLIGSGTAAGTGGGGGHTTGLKQVTSGMGYNFSGEWPQSATQTKTTTYPFRSDSGQTDYIYIVNNNADKWDDIHIKFYDANGNRVYQGGNGYVMRYSGSITYESTSTNTDGQTTNIQDAAGDYYRVPVPSGAVKFSLDNGNSTYNPNRYTEKYDLLKYDSSKEENGYTKDSNQIFTIKGSGEKQSLVQTAPIISETKVQDGTATQSNDTDYSVRTHSESGNNVSDFVYIKNTGNWTDNDVKFRFYDINGTLIKGSTSANGEYAPTKMNPNDANAGDQTWFRKEIPLNAVQFSLAKDSYQHRYDIYPQAERSTSKNFTSGNMVYETTAANNLTLLYPTDVSEGTHYTTHNPSGYTVPTDQFGDPRGDHLYLVKGSNDWSDMTVTYYDTDGQPIKNVSDESAVKGSYLGTLTGVTFDANGQPTNTVAEGSVTDVEDAVGYWYRFNIPNGAVSFVVSHGTDQTVTGEIYKLRVTIAPKRQDYTLGDMQYHISSTADTGGKYSLSLFYPTFTEVEEMILPGSDISTDTSSISNQSADAINTANGVDLTRYSDIEAYSRLGAASTPTSSSDAPADEPVLYQTDSNTISYEWSETTTNPNYNYIRFVDVYGWAGDGTKLYANLWGSSNSTNNRDRQMERDPDNAMYTIGSQSYPIYRVDITDCNYTGVLFHVENSWDNSDRTLNITLTGNGHGYMYYPATFIDDGGGVHEYYNPNGSGEVSRGRLVQVAEPSGATVTANWNESQTDTLGDYIWIDLRDSSYHEQVDNFAAYFFTVDGDNVSTYNSWPVNQAGKVTKTIENFSHDIYYFNVPDANYKYVAFINRNNDHIFIVGNIELSSSNNWGRGQVFLGEKTESPLSGYLWGSSSETPNVKVNDEMYSQIQNHNVGS